MSRRLEELVDADCAPLMSRSADRGTLCAPSRLLSAKSHGVPPTNFLRRGRERASFDWQPFSRKQKQLLSWWCDASPVRDMDGIIADGAVRSGKTVAMSAAFVLWAMTRFRDMDFALAGKTIGALRRNVVNVLKRQLKSLGYNVEDRRGDNLLIVTMDGTTNFFYLFGGKDESSQDLIQGMTLAGVLFDEVALMPESFVAQAEARCSVDGSKLWYNCNPKNPSHWFKLNYVDDANGENTKRLLYLHFTMDDNLTLSEAVKDRYRRRFRGVFYDRNILGLWVAAEGRIYISLTQDNIIPSAEWDGHPLRDRLFLATIGVDFGGSGSSTAFTLTGFTRGFSSAVVLDELRIKEAIDPTELERRFVDWARGCIARYPFTHDVYCDSAEQILIRGIRSAVAREKLPLAIHNARKSEIIDRIRFGMSMFAQGRLFILSSCLETRLAFEEALWDDKHEDERLDNGSTNIDNIDSAEYSWEPYMKTMIDIRRGGEA